MIRVRKKWFVFQDKLKVFHIGSSLVIVVRLGVLVLQGEPFWTLVFPHTKGKRTWPLGTGVWRKDRCQGGLLWRGRMNSYSYLSLLVIVFSTSLYIKSRMIKASQYTHKVLTGWRLWFNWLDLVPSRLSPTELTRGQGSSWLAAGRLH